MKRKDAWINSPQADAVAQYYTEGHTVRETAEKFGVPMHQVNNRVKRDRLTNGKDWHEAAQADNDRRSKEAEARLAEKLEGYGFEYLGGYSSKNGKFRIKCKECGAECERSASSQIGKKWIPRCVECQKRETIERHAKEKAEAEARRANKPKKQKPEMSAYQLEREKKLDDVCICKVCGCEYTPREYMQSVGVTYFSNPGYCSIECKKKHMHRISKESKKRRGDKDNHRARARKYGCEFDPSVTLARLIKKRGLRCQICGMLCIIGDDSWSEYFGAMSPTIDHIVPMSRGGGHTWDNVQVAHAICNSLKGNNMGGVQ